MEDVNWRKSSYSSSNGGDCIEVAKLPSGMAVRDSKNPAGPTLAFSSAEWGGFLGDIKNGELDI